MANTKIPSELVAINAISGTLIADNAITSVHIAENNITATQIAINAVTALQMADGTITSAKIADGTIVTADIADGQITTSKIADGTITTDDLAGGIIISSKIANNAILTQHIDDNQITADQIADNAVGVDQLAGITRGSVLTGNAAGNPSLLALGAANTLLQSDGTDLVFAPLQSGIDDNSNAVAITIDSSENVGIGTTNPTTKLHVAGIVQVVESSNAAFYGGDYVRVFGSGQQYGFRNTGGTTKANISMSGNSYFNGGNVGIGTASPQDFLEVKSTSLGGITISNSNHNQAALSFARSSTATARIFTTEPDATHTGQFNFQTSNASGGSPNLVTAMVIDDHQNVGIGTTAPDTKLHINQTSQGNFTEALRIENSGGGANEGNYIQWEVANTSGYGPRIGGRREGTGGVGLHFYTGEINAAPTEAMRIDHDGNVEVRSGAALKVYRDTNAASAQLFMDAGEKLYIRNSYANKDLVFDRDGKLGIGTASPERALHVVGGIHLPNNNVISWDQADGTLRNAIYVDSGDDMIIGDTNFDDIYFSTGQKTKTVVIKQTTGNVGIGTDNPTEKLHVSGGNVLFDFDANSGLILGNGGTNASKIYASAGDELYIGANNNYALRFLNDGSNNVVFDNGSSIAIGQSSLTGANVKLDLHNSGNGVGTQIAFYNDHNTGGHFIGPAGNTSGNIIYYNVANTSQEFYNNNQLKMTLSAAGLLTVTGGINSSSGTVSFTDGSSSFDSSDSNGYARFTHVNGSAQISLFRSGSGAGGAYLGGDSDGLHFRNGSISLKATMLQGGTFKINLNGTTDTALQIGDTNRDQAVTMSKASGGAVTREIIRFNGPLRIGTTTGSHDTYITGGGSAAVIVGNQGQLYPGSSNAQDLGSNSYPWRDLYIGDLVLTNENRKNDDGSKGNEIDGTTGNWTIQEGEKHLYIKNNKTGKQYKFVLEEIE